MSTDNSMPVPHEAVEQGADFGGYHSEWNLGSPGGWYYQLLTQRIGAAIWQRISRITGLGLSLDFSHPLLDSPPLFRDLLCRAHRRLHSGADKPVIALLAEEETLESVVENRLMVEYLCAQPGTTAVLAAPHQLEAAHGGGYRVGDLRVSVIFCDFNNSVIAALERAGKAGALEDAIRDRLVVNPRGMEPVGAKGVFEALCDPAFDGISPSTAARTPWTRRFFPRSTAGPDGSPVDDLPGWTRENWNRLVLKPEHGYSGKGVFVGSRMSDPDPCIEKALEEGSYIVQQLIPPGLWAETYPEAGQGGVCLKHRQTDFRCLIGDRGLIGFVGRFGGIPTNVGSGGGTQAIAVTDQPPGLLAGQICAAMERMPLRLFEELRQEVDEMAMKSGLAYLNGPIPQAMKPRLVSRRQLDALSSYAESVWRDCILLEELYLEGGLSKYVSLSEDEERIARMQPWRGSPALLASDGLFSFGAGLPD